MKIFLKFKVYSSECEGLGLQIEENDNKYETFIILNDAFAEHSGCDQFSIFKFGMKLIEKFS